MSWLGDGIKSAYCCNRSVLKFFRERRGWTQAELARVSGYSERLISKAESGKSISQHTVSDIAEALSTADQPVYPEDIVSDPVLFAKQYIDAFYTLQTEAIPRIEPFLDDEVVFFVQGDPAEIPFAGTFHGVAGVTEMLEKFFHVLEVPAGYEHRPNYQYIGSGNEVVVWGETWIHPIGKPLETPMEITILMRFRRGKLIHFEDRYNIKTAAAILKRKEA